MNRYLVVLLKLSWLLSATLSLPTQDSFLVKGLEKIEAAFGDFDGHMYAGLMPIHEASPSKGDELMFWLYEPTHQPNDSLVIWLNGGPGCSSFGGMLFENGPVAIPSFEAGFFGTPEAPPLIHNKYAWTNATSMLFVEQPVGTGFSHGESPPETEEDISSDFYRFLQNFYTVFDGLRDRRLFMFGESYAGMYVPSIAHYIHRKNEQKQQPSIRLSGIGLGNGWIDATVQGPAVIDYAWWHGMIDSTTKEALHSEWEACSTGSKDVSKPFHPFTVPDECGIMEVVLKAAGAGQFDWGSPNTYDVTTWDSYPCIFSVNGTFARFFNNPDVQDILHAPRKHWSVCMPGEGRRRRLLEGKLLDNDRPISMMPYIADLLDKAGIKVLVYNGDRDMSCCAQGSEMLLDSMEWSGANEWQSSQRGLWMVGDTVAGYAKSHKNLEFVVVSNSGHLVPSNQPVVAFDPIQRVLKGKNFVDVNLPTISAPDATVVKATEISETAWSFLSILLLGFVLGVACTVLYYSFRDQRYKEYQEIDDVEGVEIEER